MNDEQVSRQLQQGIVGNGRLVELLREAINCLETAGLPVTSAYFRRALAEALVDIQMDDRVRGDDGAADDVRPTPTTP
jgi:hypothetical protein